MIAFELLIRTDAEADVVERVVVDALERLGGPAVASAAMTGSVLPVDGPVAPELYEEILGVPATAEVYFGLNPKVRAEGMYVEAERRVGVVAAAVAAELDAEACLLFELEKVVFRRSKGELVLYDWFIHWGEVEIQAMLPEPFRMTSEFGRL